VPSSNWLAKLGLPSVAFTESRVSTPGSTEATSVRSTT